MDSAEFEQRDSPEVDDVFAQSVEPLLPLHDELQTCETVPVVNGDTTLSNESLASSSTSKIIKVLKLWRVCLDMNVSIFF